MVHHEEVAIWWSDWVDSWDIDIEEYPDQWTTGWWFGTFFVFPNSWDDDPIWLVFFRGVETTNSTKMCIFVSVIGHDCEPPYGTKNQDAYSNWPYMGVSENWGYPKHIGFSLQNIIKPLDDSWVPHDSRNLRDQNFWTRQNIWQCWLSMKYAQDIPKISLRYPWDIVGFRNPMKSHDAPPGSSGGFQCESGPGGCCGTGCAGEVSNKKG